MSKNISVIDNKYSVYIIHGEEDFLRIEYTNKFHKEALSKNYLKKTFLIDSINFNWQEIDFFDKQQELFSEKILIEINIINGKIGLKGSAFISNLVNIKFKDTIILFIFPKLDKLQLQSKWFNEISKVAKIIEAKKVTIDKLPFWIKERLQKYNLTIDKDALDLFINKTEGNLLSASQEIQKLYLNLDNKANITLEDIEKKVTNNAVYDIFQLSVVWMKGDIKRIINLIDSFRLNSQEPILILWAITEDIRTLLKLKHLIVLGNDTYNVCNKLRLWSDKRKFSLIAINKISNKMLLSCLQECALIDQALKGVFKEDVWSMFKRLLISLALCLK